MDLLSPIVTSSGWVYSTGSLHLLGNNVFGWPMYFPDEGGQRVYSGKRYTKFLRYQRPDLLPVQPYDRCAQIDPWSSLIPTECIIDGVDTRRALEDWLSSSSDPRVGSIKHVLDRAGIKTSQCGLGGSTGLGCIAPDSDLDLLIFDSSSALPCRNAIEAALLDGELTLMTDEIVSSYATRYARLYNLSQSHLHSVFSHDVTKAYRQGQKISFIFTYNENEREKIPARLYTKDAFHAPEIRMNAWVVDGTGSWLYPRKYIVEKDGQEYQIWSHHWLRDPITPAGTLVEVVGRNLGDGVILLSDLHHHIAPFN